MPEFILSTPAKRSHPFYDLDTFARAYVEAMFFTNGDTGDNREHLLNDWGVQSLTAESVEAIKRDCDQFRDSLLPSRKGARVRDLLTLLETERGYTEEQAGRDFWFTRQGHGVGFWDRDELAEPFGDLLTEAAKAMGESYVEAYRRKVHVR
jgi:hypothetical protein